MTSGAYSLHTAPATIKVLWTLEIEPAGSEISLFRCVVEVRLPPLLALLARLTLLPVFLRRHVESETPRFAANLARKVADGRVNGLARAVRVLR